MLRDYFVAVIEATSSVVEVDASSILSDCKTSEVVEARCIAIKILHDEGYSTQRIAKYFYKTEPGIRCILASYDARLQGNPLIVRMVEEIKKKLSSK